MNSRRKFGNRFVWWRFNFLKFEIRGEFRGGLVVPCNGGGFFDVFGVFLMFYEVL